MANLKTKPNLALVTPSKLAAVEADIESLNLATGKLRDADRELVREEKELQGAEKAADDALNAAALELLDGPAEQAVPVKTKHVRIAEINVERRKIAKALEIAENRLHRLHFERMIERRKEAADGWAELQRERALAAARLISLNRRAQQMLGPLYDHRGYVDMPAAFGQKPASSFLLGNGSTNAGEAYEFIECCILCGIVTRGEIEKEQGQS